ncbi:MAG TPA: LamG-like jellyroll fold domain-containing protein, partial [Parafilimonas sp.]|nr:LamG-like jellyroll fold domain-containing protein [Parafilimonas sp.]
MKKKILNRSILSVLVFFLFSIISKPLQAQTGLIGYWPFDGNGTDQSGNTRNVTLVGSPTFATGLFGQAVSLDGTGNMYAQRAIDDSVFDFSARDFTVSVWVKFNTIANEQVLIEKFTGVAGPGWTLTKLSTQELRFAAPPVLTMTSGALNISTGVWHNFIITRLSDDFKLYVDSKLILQQTASGAISNSSDPLLIGRRDAADGRIFGVNGLIDEAAIWSRSLCDNEITLIWNNGKGTAANLTACCNKPVGLKAKKITSSSATLTWKPVTGAAKYKLQYRVQGTTSWTSKTITDTFYNATGLAASTMYEFRVQTYCTADGFIKSKFSKIATFSTAAFAQNAV